MPCFFQKNNQNIRFLLVRPVNSNTIFHYIQFHFALNTTYSFLLYPSNINIFHIHEVPDILNEVSQLEPD